jgi:hypothetical protein
MAADCIITNVAAIAACNAIVDLLDAGSPPGFIKIYDNTDAVPADADAGLGSNVLLVTLTLNSTAFGAAADGTGKATATANAVTNGTAVADGTAAFFRATNAAGTAVIQGTCGTSSADLVLNSVAITTGATVSVTAWTFSVPEQA